MGELSLLPYASSAPLSSVVHCHRKREYTTIICFIKWIPGKGAIVYDIMLNLTIFEPPFCHSLMPCCHEMPYPSPSLCDIIYEFSLRQAVILQDFTSSPFLQVGHFD